MCLRTRMSLHRASSKYSYVYIKKYSILSLKRSRAHKYILYIIIHVHGESNHNDESELCKTNHSNCMRTLQVGYITLYMIDPIDIFCIFIVPFLYNYMLDLAACALLHI